MSATFPLTPLYTFTVLWWGANTNLLHREYALTEEVFRREHPVLARIFDRHLEEHSNKGSSYVNTIYLRVKGMPSDIDYIGIYPYENTTKQGGNPS